MKLITADKDPNFLNRLEARSQAVIPADRLDHTLQAVEITAPLFDGAVTDHTTGSDVREPSIFNNPANRRSLQKEDGYLPANKLRPSRIDPITGKVKPVFIIKVDKKGKETKVQVEAPFRYNELTGEKEYEDYRPIGRRIASDIHGNPVTFATKPGEAGVRRVSKDKMPEVGTAAYEDYYGDDTASMYEAARLPDFDRYRGSGKVRNDD